MARLLIIDDDDTMRGLIVATLECAGHEVMHAGTGRDAIALFRQRPAEVVITDIMMPDDSIEQVIALREEFPAVSFIVTSGLMADSPRINEIALLLGARRVLAKPFRLAALLQATEEVLAERAGRPRGPK